MALLCFPDVYQKCISGTDFGISGFLSARLGIRPDCTRGGETGNVPVDVQSGADMKQLARHQVGGVLLAALGSLAAPAQAAEGGFGFYIEGLAVPDAGVLPQPGVYFDSSTYFYNGKIGGNRTTQLGGNVVADVMANIVADFATGLWVTPAEILGGNLAFAFVMPFGTRAVRAGALLNGPLVNQVIGRPVGVSVSDATFNAGDPIVGTSLGWHSGNWHWKVAGLLSIPAGAYEPGQLSNIALNRYIGDISAAATYLDPALGIELSAAAGFTLNGKNPATQYVTGHEFHVEVSASKNLTKELSIGVIASHYQQATTRPSRRSAPPPRGQGRLAPLSAELLPPLSPSRAPPASGRHLHQSYRLPLRHKERTMTDPLPSNAALDEEAAAKTISRRRMLLGGTALAASVAGTAPTIAQAQQPAPAPQPAPVRTGATGRPVNILVMFGDDIGQANISAYTFGQMGYRTPNIDRIAREGMMLTDYYAEQSCTAGRSSLSPANRPCGPACRRLAYPARRWVFRRRIQRWRNSSSRSATPRGSSARTISATVTSTCRRTTASTSSSATSITSTPRRSRSSGPTRAIPSSASGSARAG